MDFAHETEAMIRRRSAPYLFGSRFSFQLHSVDCSEEVTEANLEREVAVLGFGVDAPTRFGVDRTPLHGLPEFRGDPEVEVAGLEVVDGL